MDPEAISTSPKAEHSHAEGRRTDKEDILIDQAYEGTGQEHALGTMEAVRIYWKAVILTVVVTTSIIMRGYDASVAPSFIALPAFRNRYGYPVKGHGNQVPAQWQSALGVATVVGQVFGSYLITFPMDRYGRRLTLIVCLILTSAIIPMQAFAPSIQVLTAGEYIGGFILGSYQVLIPTYSAELLPTVLRPYLAAYICVNYYIGGLLTSGITAGFDNWTTEWAYRIPFMLQWVWPAIVIPTLLITPESPWWLVRNNRPDDARKALCRLSTKHPKVDVDKTLAMMQKTTLYEDKVATGGSIWDCFKGTALRRTEIVIMIFFCQDFALSPISSSYFYEQLNFSTDKSFDLSIGNSVVNLVCGLLSFLFLRYVGRRSTFTWGIGIVALFQLVIGFLQLPSDYNTNKSYSLAQVIILFVASAFYALSVGPITYTILTEVPSMKLRSKSVAISIVIDAICGIVTGIFTPYLLNPGDANAKGKIDFLWGGISIISFLWCFFRLPETQNRTFEEIDLMFENRVPTRKFKKYVIDQNTLKHDLEE